LAVRLFIGNLPYGATEAELREHLSPVAVPTHIMMPVDRETGRPRGFAFVEFGERALAEEAIRRFDGQPFMGRSRGPGDRPGGPPGPRIGRPPDGGPAAPRGSFGPPAPPRRQRGAGPKKHKTEPRPKGPIPIRAGGRLYGVEDDETGAEPVDFEDFATSASEPEEPED
jgi:hypothetical protein